MYISIESITTVTVNVVGSSVVPHLYSVTRVGYWIKYFLVLYSVELVWIGHSRYGATGICEYQTGVRVDRRKWSLSREH